MTLTAEDYRTIRYFIIEKGDVSRWCDWEQKKAEVASERPELIAALTNVLVAERTLRAIVDSLPVDDDDGGA